ncbi:D123-domain-containing protein [Absidia repens]|uniref:D123-domain-containing protein n=1 Tax=Absidia repens TaxID=90262 RepID=A0A1X2J1X6_9FUNG|nr:D123-domain-containing protein [Absidia repens]
MPAPLEEIIPSTTIDSTPDDVSPIPVTAQDIVNCSFASWYERFRPVTFKSKVVPLSTDFVHYLNADGIYLPTDGAAATIEELDSSDDDEANDSQQNQDDNVSKITPHFPMIEQAIRQAVDDFGGAVFPKLNWSSPRDAAWISTTQSLKCSSPFDVFLLLKSSDFINHDLNHAFEVCGQDQQPENDISYDLVLRKWHDLQPSLEFRCFVKNKEIIGISQRDMTYYGFLIDIQQELETKIYQFFEDYIHDGFSNTNYVFDVYIQQDRQKVWLVDFNPFAETTDALLYSWDELNKFDIENDDPEIRIIESTPEANALNCNAPRFAANMVPKDVIDLSDGRSIAEFAEEFQRAMALSATQQDDDDSD